MKVRFIFNLFSVICNLRKKYNVHFDIINKEDIAKMEPSLEPIYYKGIVLKGESFTISPIKITKKIFDNLNLNPPTTLFDL